MNEQELISLTLVKYQPDYVDNIFIKLVINSPKTGMVEFRFSEEQFHRILAQLDATGSFEITK